MTRATFSPKGTRVTLPSPAPTRASWGKRFYGGCDPAQVVHVHIRELGSPGWRFALLFRDWLVHVPAEREAYAAEKRRLLAIDDDTDAYVAAKEPWFDDAWRRAQEWADADRLAAVARAGRAAYLGRLGCCGRHAW